MNSLHTQEEIVPVWHRIKDVWLYPLKSSPLMVIGIAAFVTLATSWLSFNWFFEMCVLAYVYKFGSEVLWHTANGNLEPPDFASQVDENSGWNQIKVFVCFIVAGVLAYRLLPWQPAMAVWLVLLLGYPAATMQVAINGGWLAALNPLTWFAAIARIGWAYLGVVLLTLAFAFSRGYLQEHLVALPAPIRIFLFSAVSYYFAIASFFLLGYVVYQYHEELGFDAKPQEAVAPLSKLPKDPDQELLDECEILVQDGKLNVAAERMGAHLKMRGGTALFHQRYRKLLTVLDNKLALLAHAQLWINVLLAQHQEAQAVLVLQESLNIDPEFRPADEAAWLPVAKALAPRNADQALKIMQGFHGRFPKSKQIGQMMLLAAKTLVEQKANIASANKLLEQAILRFPNDAAIPELQQYHQQLLAKLPAQ
jgi:tetratricopeptide (TPR) repeat protein